MHKSEDVRWFVNGSVFFCGWIQTLVDTGAPNSRRFRRCTFQSSLSGWLTGCGIRIGECADTKATYILASSTQLYQIITSLVVGFRARNRVEAEGFIWILHSNEETIYSFYSPLCSLPFITLPAPFSIYLHPSTTSFPFCLFSIFYIAYFFSEVFFFRMLTFFIFLRTLYKRLCSSISSPNWCKACTQCRRGVCVLGVI
ncbi:hypothetical protein B0H14DRAFT_1655206 [Mycena olivaceomarginata]|nr:hypothetical protein B0H14DRAFT_1655206 [Mycena olivaceomarginata]